MSTYDCITTVMLLLLTIYILYDIKYGIVSLTNGGVRVDIYCWVHANYKFMYICSLIIIVNIVYWGYLKNCWRPFCLALDSFLNVLIHLSPKYFTSSVLNLVLVSFTVSSVPRSTQPDVFIFIILCCVNKLLKSIARFLICHDISGITVTINPPNLFNLLSLMKMLEANYINH